MNTLKYLILMLSLSIFVTRAQTNDSIKTRPIQVSFFYPIGTNGLESSMYTNQFSFNVLTGYSKGVDGFEIGGLVNMVDGDVTGCQIGGLSNLVGGHVNGLQVAGISNLSQGNVDGFQIAGISSVVNGDVKGLQVSGIASVVRGTFDGVQVSGISNLVLKKSYGLQIAGVYNQVIDSLMGSQISGVGNCAFKGYTLNQMSGVFNLTNVNSGIQISSIFNHANHNKGLQIGLINTSVKSSGIAIGLINIVKEGYGALELSTNEAFQFNILIKSGVKKLYNTYSFAHQIGTDNLMSAGLGIGRYFDLSKRLMLSADGSVNSTFTKDNYNSVHSKLSLTVDFKILKWLTVYAGPSLNSDFAFEGGESIDISYTPFSETNFSNGIMRYWGGAQFGVRLIK